MALVKNKTYTFSLEAKKDGVTWDITGATVTLIFRKPDGTTSTKIATITSGVGGLAEYTTLTTDLDVISTWSRAWNIVLGSIDVRSEPIAFSVINSP